MVRPAKAPPKRTKVTAIPRYRYKLGSLASLGSSSIMFNHLFMGAASTDEKWPRPIKRALERPRTIERKAAKPFEADAPLCEGMTRGKSRSGLGGLSFELKCKCSGSGVYRTLRYMYRVWRKAKARPRDLERP